MSEVDQVTFNQMMNSQTKFEDHFKLYGWAEKFKFEKGKDGEFADAFTNAVYHAWLDAYSTGYSRAFKIGYNYAVKQQSKRRHG